MHLFNLENVMQQQLLNLLFGYFVAQCVKVRDVVWYVWRFDTILCYTFSSVLATYEFLHCIPFEF